MPEQLPGCLDFCGAVRQPETYRLMVKNRGAKTLPVFGVAQRKLECAARHANALRRNANAPAL